MIKKDEESLLSIFWIAIIILTITFLTYFNIQKMDDFIRPDFEVEKVFARTMWREKSLFPQSWYHSVEPQNLRPTILTALLWGLTGNMQLSHSITLLFMMILAVLSAYYMFSGLSNIRKSSILVGIEALLAGFGPNFSWWFFIFYGTYAFTMVSMFLLAGYLLRLYNGKESSRFARIGIMVIFTLLGIVGPRALIYTLLPYICVIIYMGLYDFALHKNIISTKALLIGGGSACVANIIGLIVYLFIFSGSNKVPADTIGASWGTVEKLWDNFGKGVINALKNIGIEGGGRLASLDGVDCLIKICVVAATIYALIGLKKNFDNDKKFLVNLYSAASIATLFFSSSLSITGDGNTQNYYWYYYSVTFLIITLVVLVLDSSVKIRLYRYSLNILVAIMVFVNIIAVYVINLDVIGNVSEKKVSEFLILNNVKYGYAPYNTAYSIQAASDEKIEMVSLFSDINSENAEDLDIWYFNIDQDVVIRAQNYPNTVLILTEDEESAMLEATNSMLYKKSNYKIADIDNYNLYVFNEFPFTVVE